MAASTACASHIAIRSCLVIMRRFLDEEDGGSDHRELRGTARRMVTRTPNGPVGVGFIGSGSVLFAYLQQLDRLVARGLAREGPICVRRPEARRVLHDRRP